MSVTGEIEFWLVWSTLTYVHRIGVHNGSVEASRLRVKGENELKWKECYEVD